MILRRLLWWILRTAWRWWTWLWVKSRVKFETWPFFSDTSFGTTTTAWSTTTVNGAFRWPPPRGARLIVSCWSKEQASFKIKVKVKGRCDDSSRVTDVSDSGNYTCAPSSSLPASIQVFVSGNDTFGSVVIHTYGMHGWCWRADQVLEPLIGSCFTPRVAFEGCCQGHANFVKIVDLHLRVGLLEIKNRWALLRTVFDQRAMHASTEKRLVFFSVWWQQLKIERTKSFHQGVVVKARAGAGAWAVWYMTSRAQAQCIIYEWIDRERGERKGRKQVGQPCRLSLFSVGGLG